MNPTIGDFSKGPKLPYKLSLLINRIIHHQWRFYFLAGALVIIGSLAFLGLKMPWKTDKTLSPTESSGTPISFNPLTPSVRQQQKAGDDTSDTKDTGGSSKPAGNAVENGDDAGDGDSSGGGDDNSGANPGGGDDDGDDDDDGPPPTSSGFPTPQNTGPRYSAQSTNNGSIHTSHNGQVIERMTINGNLYIEHSNVTVRDVTVNGTGRYMIHVRSGGSGCPSGTRIEYTELNGIARPTSEGASQMYLQCPAVVDHVHIHNVWIGIRFSSGANGSTVTNSYLLANLTAPGAHREAILSNGSGGNNVIEHNTLYCTGSSGCSSAMSIYGDFGQQTNWLIKDNLMSTDGGYCLYGGSSSNDPYPNGTDIRVIGNHFSTLFRPNCGRYGAITSFQNNVRGNECHGNVWHETGLSADDEC